MNTYLYLRYLTYYNVKILDTKYNHDNTVFETLHFVERT